MALAVLLSFLALAVVVPKMVGQHRDNKSPAHERNKDAMKSFSSHRQVAILQGLFCFQRYDLRQTEIHFNVSPPPRTFGFRSAAPAHRAQAPRHWSRSACG